MPSITKEAVPHASANNAMVAVLSLRSRMVAAFSHVRGDGHESLAAHLLHAEFFRPLARIS